MPQITLDCVTAKKVIDKLESERIAFSIKEDHSDIKKIPVSSYLRSTNGLGAKVSIRVTQSDAERFDLICKASISPITEHEVPPRILLKERRWYKRLFGEKN